MVDSLKVQILKSLMDEMEDLKNKLKRKGEEYRAFIDQNRDSSDFNELKNVAIQQIMLTLSPKDKVKMADEVVKMMLKTDINKK